MKTIAVLSIGQTPRTDILEDLGKYLPEQCKLTEYGLLDGLTRSEAEKRFGYRGAGEMLITRMGKEKQMIRLAEEEVMKQMQVCVERAENDGSDLMLMACTGNFPQYMHKIPLLLPGIVQRMKAIQLAQGAEIGVIIPHAGQRELITQWWKDCRANVTLLEVANPFGDINEIIAAGLRLKASGAAVLCMDCFGYTSAQQTKVQQATGLKTVLPREVLMEEAIRILNGEVL